MRIATIDNRAHLIDERGDELFVLDIEHTSAGKYASTTADLMPIIGALTEWHTTLTSDQFTRKVTTTDLQAPISNPRQVFAIGMNYLDHAAEVELAVPTTPAVFTKFASSICGPHGTVELPSESVDWEVELVAVVGRGGRNIPKDQAYEHIAGYMIGQDLSDRELQFAGESAPQFSLAKSYANFAPTGPWITTSDQVADPAGLIMSCARGSQLLQHGSTKNLVFDIPFLIEHLSSVVELFPGDLIFTGTPDGVGFGRTPQEYLVEGDELVSTIEGLGELRQHFVPAHRGAVVPV